MTFPFPYGGIRVTVEQPTYDRFNDVSGWTYRTIDDCVDYPDTTAEGQLNSAVVNERTLLVPADATPPTAVDRVVLHAPGEADPPLLNTALRRAQTYSVVGVPKEWIHAMTGWKPGTTVQLQRVT
jgi:hypothetical protein